MLYYRLAKKYGTKHNFVVLKEDSGDKDEEETMPVEEREDEDEEPEMDPEMHQEMLDDVEAEKERIRALYPEEL